LSTDLQTVLAIIVMALATYATRITGYWLLQGREVKGRMKAAMDAVPAAILVSVIAPNVFLQGPANMIAGAVTLAAALARLPLLAIIAVGVAAVAVARMF
jgi:uncharacterized membrane protein